MKDIIIFSSAKADAKLHQVCRHQQKKCRVSLPQDPATFSPEDILSRLLLHIWNTFPQPRVADAGTHLVRVISTSQRQLSCVKWKQNQGDNNWHLQVSLFWAEGGGFKAIWLFLECVLPALGTMRTQVSRSYQPLANNTICAIRKGAPWGATQWHIGSVCSVTGKPVLTRGLPQEGFLGSVVKSPFQTKACVPQSIPPSHGQNHSSSDFLQQRYKIPTAASPRRGWNLMELRTATWFWEPTC